MIIRAIVYVYVAYAKIIYNCCMHGFSRKKAKHKMYLLIYLLVIYSFFPIRSATWNGTINVKFVAQFVLINID